MCRRDDWACQARAAHYTKEKDEILPRHSALSIKYVFSLIECAAFSFLKY